MNELYDVLIVGSGPAGLSAAIYASRANLKTMVIESYMPGGKLSKTYEIENYPAIEKISGVDLATQLMSHGMKFGAMMDYGEVVSVKTVDDHKETTLNDGRVFLSKTVIIATGTRERLLQIPEADRYTGRGISYCAVCDGSFYRGKDVAVIGGGNSALEEALYLANVVNKVYIVIRRDQFRAEAGIVDRVLANEKIEVIYKHLPEELIIENEMITGLKLRSADGSEEKAIAVSGIFPYIGADPCTEFLDSSLLDEKGYIIADSSMETKEKGIYAAGDVIVKELRQVVTAAGDGAVAANSVIRYLQSSK